MRLKYFSLKRLTHPFFASVISIFLHFIYFQTIVSILSKFSSDASTYQQFLKICALCYPPDAYPMDLVLQWPLPSPHSGPCHLVGGRNDPARCQPFLGVGVGVGVGGSGEKGIICNHQFFLCFEIRLVNTHFP